MLSPHLEIAFKWMKFDLNDVKCSISRCLICLQKCFLFEHKQQFSQKASDHLEVASVFLRILNFGGIKFKNRRWLRRPLFTCGSLMLALLVVQFVVRFAMFI